MSTEKQAEAGLSLGAQTEKIRAMAVCRGLVIHEVLVDAGASAKSLDRPEMLRLLDRVDAGLVDTLIIAKLDRLTRSVVDLDDLLHRFARRHVTLISVAEVVDTSSVSGQMMLSLITLLSEWERKSIGERTRDVMQHKRAKGERVGTLPFGAQLAVDGLHLEPAPVECRILAQMRHAKAQGHSYNQIALDLTASGETTRRGTRWRPQYIAHAMKKVSA